MPISNRFDTSIFIFQAGDPRQGAKMGAAMGAAAGGMGGLAERRRQRLAGRY